MNRFWDWLDKEPTNWRETLRIIFVFLCVSLAWSALMASIVIALGIRVTAENLVLLSHSLWYVLSFLFVGAAIEEMLFRFPLIFFAQATDSRSNLFTAVAVLSAVFGLAHGGPMNLPIQGVAGVLLSIVFLKCGGLHDRPVKGLLASTVTHFLYNVALVVFVVAMR